MDHSDIGIRMKAYENCYRIYFPRRQALIMRLDLRAGHTYTKGFRRPFDKIFAQCIQHTMKKLCENIEGAKFGYCESDEISIALTDYETINTEPWFGNNLQKIVSISASMASLFFKEKMREIVSDLLYSWSNIDWNNEAEMKENEDRLRSLYGMPESREEWDEYVHIIQSADCNKYAVFDCRVFLIPREEIVNYFYWRELDCSKNSIQMAAQSQFSHKELQGLDCNKLQEKLFQERGINWAKDYPNEFRNGASCYKRMIDVFGLDGSVVQRNKWYIDLNTPVFTQDRNYIEKHFIFK